MDVLDSWSACPQICVTPEGVSSRVCSTGSMAHHFGEMHNSIASISALWDMGVDQLLGSSAKKSVHARLRDIGWVK